MLPVNWFHHHLAETDSTMLCLRRADYAEREEEFVLLTTDYQTAGRGQRGTHWEAERGANLLFGILCHPTFLRADEQFFLSEVQALAVADALAEHVDGVSIKWPNDVYVGDRKICGMLLEHDLSGQSIATTITGVGINVNQRQFVGDAPNPISLRQLLGHNTSRDELMTTIATNFEHYYRELQIGHADALHHRYLSHLYRRTGLHRFATPDGREFLAAIADVKSTGQIVLQTADGVQREFAFKEISYLTESSDLKR